MYTKPRLVLQGSLTGSARSSVDDEVTRFMPMLRLETQTVPQNWQPAAFGLPPARRADLSRERQLSPTRRCF